MGIPSLPPATLCEQAANLRGCSLNSGRILVGPVEQSGTTWFLLAVLLGKKGMLETHMVGLPVRPPTNPEVLWFIPLKNTEDWLKLPAMFREAAEDARWGLIAHLQNHFKQVENLKNNTGFRDAIEKFRVQERGQGVHHG